MRSRPASLSLAVILTLLTALLLPVVASAGGAGGIAAKFFKPRNMRRAVKKEFDVKTARHGSNVAFKTPSGAKVFEIAGAKHNGQQVYAAFGTVAHGNNGQRLTYDSYDPASYVVWMTRSPSGFKTIASSVISGGWKGDYIKPYRIRRRSGQSRTDTLKMLHRALTGSQPNAENLRKANMQNEVEKITQATKTLLPQLFQQMY